MPFAFFKIASDADSDAASDLNRFLATHRSVTVTRQWVERDGAWAFCVEYTALTGSDSARPPGAGKVDYREILPPEQFEIFARLRLVRKALAGRDGLPVFAVFSNEQLAEIVRRGCDSLAALKEIAGLGEQRVTKYGADVLAAMKEPAAPPAP